MPPPRPVSVTVLSILGIIWGGLLLVVGLAALALLLAGAGQNDPLTRELYANPGYGPLSLVGSLLSLVLNALLLAGSIAALRLRPGARPALLVWAVGALLMLTYSTILQMLYIMPVVQRQLATQLQAGADEQRMLGLFMQGGAACSVLFSAALPAAMLIVYNRASVIAAFSGARAPSAAPPPPL